MTNQNIRIYIYIPIIRSFKNIIKALVNLFISLIQINPDILIQRSSGIPTALIALYSKIFKKKFIFSIAHEDDVIKKGKLGIGAILYKFGLKNADFIIAQSENQILELEAWRKEKFNNIKVIKSGYEISDVDYVAKKYILWVGRAIKWKRPELFLELAQKFSNEKFIMVFNKPLDLNYLSYWKKIYNKAQEISNLKFIRSVPFSKIDKYFKDAKLYINTSLREGFPNTFLQALKNKTPILSLNVNPDNFLNTYRCGLNCNNDFNKLIKNLRVLLKNKTLYNDYVKNTFNYVKINHEIKNITEDWIKLINVLYKN